MNDAKVNPEAIALRQAFEDWYTLNAFDLSANPIGSRECHLQWRAWMAASRAAPSPATPEAEGPKRHLWNQDGETCLDCGQKDWMRGSVCTPASPPAAHPSPERIQFVHGLQLLLDKLYRFHAGAMNRHEVSAFQICKNELSAFMESVKSGSLNQNDASQAAAQEQKPEPYAYAVVCDQHTPSLIWPSDKGNYTIAQGHGAKLVPLFASPIPYTQADYDRNAIKVPADVKATAPSIGEPALGWVMVPREPTDEMEHRFNNPRLGPRADTFTARYKAMLSVAPGETK